MSDNGSGTSETSETSGRVALRVVRGRPDDVELAALTAVVAGLSAPAAAPEPPRRTSRWADRAALVRAPVAPGAGAWRASGLPR